MIRSLVASSSLALLLWSQTAQCHPVSPAECREGGEFIRNAALARDSGITREFFIGQLEQDLMLIRAFPPHLRWFAQDEEDERFLSEQAAAVFDAPRAPEQHEADFVRACLLLNAGFDPSV